ncbi:MAG: NADH-quinone oxidoreductase subunit J [Gammaproteobacteria bacterium]
MSIEQIVFYVFAAIAVYAGFRVITSKNTVHAALHLVLAFFSMSAIWLLAEAEFLAIALILVYVGAVMVLLLFVIMMLDVNAAPLREGMSSYAPVGVLIAGVIIYLMVTVLTGGFGEMEAPARHAAEYSNTEELGLVLYTVYLYPFEIAAVILLVAIVAAIALTMRRRPGLKYQDISKQVNTKREDRLKLVKMDAEKPTVE